ncbi:conjugal transfer mating pair stabilization protein TraG [Raoultella planticola]|uniref:Conjugal transfer mating pair stabilization protein TraG n=1 Tax=Raoultella planticola TaxID=575 RepID=A0A485D413_RAOPL|nr:conjugal transfer mating pair stabilization protein TraG [Raoultella planticola]
MAYYAKQNGVPVVLSELSQLQLKNSDIATTAGYISMMIPPLTWAMIKSMGAGLLQRVQPFCFVRPQLDVAGLFQRG